MSLATWQETLVAAQVDGAALSNTTTPTSLLNAGSKFTLPAGFFGFVGKTIRITAHGRMTTVITSPGNLTLDVRFGATAVITTGLLPQNVVVKTNLPWFYQVTATLRAVGATANFMPGGFVLGEGFLNTAAAATGPGPGGYTTPFATAPVVGSNFDSTASQVVDFFGTYGTANLCSITLHQFMLESLN